MNLVFRIICATIFLSINSIVHGDLTLNSSAPITTRVAVNVIGVQNTNGSNPSPLFGTPSQQSSIFDFVDDIWAQAGIDIAFTTGTVYKNTFANFGSGGARPSSDLNAIVSGAPAGIRAPNALDLFMVNVVPGFSQNGNNGTNGIASIGGDGMAMWAGPNLFSFNGGREIIASVLAHEIGHNLGLPHIGASQNLMQSGGSGERLNSSQISTARSTATRLGVATAVPEPNAFLLVALIGSGFGLKRFCRRSDRTQTAA